MLSRRSSSARRSQGPALSKVSPRTHVATLISKLKSFYPAGEWGLFSEVRNTTGCADILRYADALAVHLYDPVDGFQIHGFEVKTSRSDWLRELQQPEKCGPLKLFCSAWWLVVPAPWKNIVNSKGEVPDRWGMIEVGAGGPSIVSYAVERVAEEPVPGFLKSLLRSALAAAEHDEEEGGAPLVRVTQISRQHVGLACGHTTIRPFAKVMPQSIACFGCAEGRPTDLEFVEAALEGLRPEDRARLAALLLPAAGIAS